MHTVHDQLTALLTELVGSQLDLTIASADNTGEAVSMSGVVERLRLDADGMSTHLHLLTETRQPRLDVGVYRNPVNGDIEVAVFANGVRIAVPVTFIDPDPRKPLSSHRRYSHRILTMLRRKGAPESFLTQIVDYLRAAATHHSGDDTHPAVNYQPKATMALDLNPAAWADASIPIGHEAQVAHGNSQRAANAIFPVQVAHSEQISSLRDGGTTDLVQVGLNALAAYPARSSNDTGASNVASLLADSRHLADAYRVELDAPSVDDPKARIRVIANAANVATSGGVNEAAVIEPGAALEPGMVGYGIHLLAEALRALVESHRDGHDTPCLYCEGPPNREDDTFEGVSERAFERYLEELTGAA